MPRVLIVDDSLSVLKVAERMLAQAGFEVATAKSGTEALQRLPDERPDVIVSDVLMPDKTGYEVCIFVRSHPALADIPVLLISGILSDEVARQAETCRADGILKKPFQGSTLQDRVLELIAKRKQAAAEKVAVPDTPPAGPVPAEVGQITPKEVTAATPPASPMNELEAALAAERTRVAELTERLAKAEAAEARVIQLEATLCAERDAANQLVEQFDQLEQAAGRAQELETLLAKETEKTAQLSRKLMEMEHAAAQSPPGEQDIS